MSVPQVIENTRHQHHTIVQVDITIYHYHHVLVIMTDKNTISHRVHVTVPMNGHGQNQEVSITIASSCIRTIVTYVFSISERCYKSGKLGHIKRKCTSKFRKRPERKFIQYIFHGPSYLYQR